MATIKNISGEPRLVPGLGPFGSTVLEGQEVEVRLADVTAYTQQESTWAPADDDAKKAHQTMLDDIAAMLAAERIVDGEEEQPAREVVKALKVASREQVVAILANDERPSVTKAAEARLEEIDAPPVDTDADATPAPDNDAQEG